MTFDTERALLSLYDAEISWIRCRHARTALVVIGKLHFVWHFARRGRAHQHVCETQEHLPPLSPMLQSGVFEALLYYRLHTIAKDNKNDWDTEFGDL